MTKEIRTSDYVAGPEILLGCVGFRKKENKKKFFF